MDLKSKLDETIQKHFDIDYPKEAETFSEHYVGSIEDVYEKAFKTATRIKEEEMQLQMADAQFVGFKHGKWNHSDIIGLAEGMGLTKKEWNEWKKKYPQCLDENDFEELNSHFKDKRSN